MLLFWSYRLGETEIIEAALKDASVLIYDSTAKIGKKKIREGITQGVD